MSDGTSHPEPGRTGSRSGGRPTARWHDELGVALAFLTRLPWPGRLPRSEEHTSELQSLMRISYAVFCLKKKKKKRTTKDLTLSNQQQITNTSNNRNQTTATPR